jgi:hypothetical protein
MAYKKKSTAKSIPGLDDTPKSTYLEEAQSKVDLTQPTPAQVSAERLRAGQAYLSQREKLASEAGITSKQAGSALIPTIQAGVEKETAEAVAQAQGKAEATAQQNYTSELNVPSTGGESPQGVIGKGLAQSPLGLIQQKTGIPFFDLSTGDVDRLSRAAVAVGAAATLGGGIAAGIFALGSKVATFKSAALVGSLAGLGTSAINTALRGSDLDNSIESTKTSADEITSSLKAGVISTQEATAMLNELNQILANQEQTLKVLSSTTGRFFPDKGVQLANKYSNAQLAYRQALLTKLRLEAGVNLTQ